MKSKIISTLIVVNLLVACARLTSDLTTLGATATAAPTQTPYPTVTLIPSPTVIPTFTAVVLENSSIPDIYQRPETSGWTAMIAQEPQNAELYYRRADAIYIATPARGSLEIYRDTLNIALQDINTAIALQPDNGDYYYLRRSIYDKLTGTTEYIVDQQAISRLALEDAYQEARLGTPFNAYPDRIIINELIATDQCDLALTQVEELIKELPAGDISLGGLLHIRSRAYACLGRLEDALQSVNDSMFNNEYMEYKNTLKVQYLILLGKYDEALPMLNEKICNCEFPGWNYYLRAEIYFNTGKKDLVQDELITGMPKTWQRGGMLPYVEAQMALDEGRTEDAIPLLQFAEATFSDPIYNSLRWKVQELLQELGAELWVVTPSVSIPGTSTP